MLFDHRVVEDSRFKQAVGGAYAFLVRDCVFIDILEPYHAF